MNKFNKLLSASAMLCVSAGIAWASCGETAGLVKFSLAETVANLATSFAESAKKLISFDQFRTEQMLSSIRLATAQVSVSNEKVAGTIIKSHEAAASVAKEIADKELLDKVVLDYTSQGFDPCVQSSLTQRLAQAESDVRALVSRRISEDVDLSPGKMAAKSAILQLRENRHQEMFCTQTEVDAGICAKLGKVPGGDVNAALLFSDSKTEEAVAAKNATINNIVGLPAAPIPKEVANTPEGQSYLLATKERDAYLAWSVYSLKNIQTENEQYKKVMDERVGQYFGGDRAMDWAKSLSSQAKRGVLIDLVKIQGLDLKATERRIRQNMRIEANLAALLALQTRSAENNQNLTTEASRLKTKN